MKNHVSSKKTLLTKPVIAPNIKKLISSGEFKDLENHFFTYDSLSKPKKKKKSLIIGIFKILLKMVKWVLFIVLAFLRKLGNLFRLPHFKMPPSMGSKSPIGRTITGVSKPFIRSIGSIAGKAQVYALPALLTGTGGLVLATSPRNQLPLQTSKVLPAPSSSESLPPPTSKALPPSQISPQPPKQISPTQDSLFSDYEKSTSNAFQNILSPSRVGSSGKTLETGSSLPRKILPPTKGKNKEISNPKVIVGGSKNNLLPGGSNPQLPSFTQSNSKGFFSRFGDSFKNSKGGRSAFRSYLRRR